KLGPEMMAPPILGAKEGQVMPATKRPEDATSEAEILSNPRLIRSVVEHFGEKFFLSEPPAETLWQKAKRLPKSIWSGAREGVREVMVLLGLRPRISPLERVTLALADSLQVEPVRKSDVIEVRLGFPDPEAG